jgi:hypothetical protein
MTGLLCQVCGGPADRNAEGVLWLVGDDPNDPEYEGEDFLTTHPPVCMPCARKSVTACPHLRKQFSVLRVRGFEKAGVRGALYVPAWPKPILTDAASVSYTDTRINWIRAGQLIMRLRDYTIVDLPTEAQQHASRTTE